MKLYERMGIDPNTVDGIAEILGLRCDVIEKSTSKTCEKYRGNCPRCKAERLFSEVPTKKVPRISTINTAEELKQALIDLQKFCSEKRHNCFNCPYGDKGESCLYLWLEEEIEV